MKQCDKKSLLTLCLGAAGMSLRLLQNMTGFEPGTGLPIPGSLPGILLPVLLALSAVILFRMNSKLPKGPVEVPLSRLLNWNDKEGLFGILAGGCVMAFSGVLEIANAFGRTVTAVSADGMEIVTVSAGAGRSGVVMGLLAVVAGICLLAGVAICRKTPDTEPQILLAVPVLLLARLIFAYRLYSVDPVLTNYYLELLGLMLLILASYRLSGFAVQAGGPRMFGFYADLTAILAVTLLADGHSAASAAAGRCRRFGGLPKSHENVRRCKGQNGRIKKCMALTASVRAMFLQQTYKKTVFRRSLCI